MPATAEIARKPPPATLMEAMRRHHEREHQRSFDLDCDVYFPGNTHDGTTYDYASDPVRGERFWCSTCGPGRVFLVGAPPYGTRERNAFLQRTSPYLQGLLAGTPFEDHDALTEAYDRQQLGRPLPSKPTTRKGRRAAAAHRKPDYQRRLDGFGPYFLDAYAKEGSVERAIQRLVWLHESDRDAYTKVLGESNPYRAETFRQYVYAATTDTERKQAKSRWQAEQVRRRAARRAPR
jgi:hypothetical protein